MGVPSHTCPFHNIYIVAQNIAPWPQKNNFHLALSAGDFTIHYCLVLLHGQKKHFVNFCICHKYVHTECYDVTEIQLDCIFAPENSNFVSSV